MTRGLFDNRIRCACAAMRATIGAPAPARQNRAGSRQQSEAGEQEIAPDTADRSATANPTPPGRGVKDFILILLGHDLTGHGLDKPRPM